MREREYQRLTRARSRSAFAVALMSRSSLWLGKDHLLCIDSSGYTETYKRFYFRDIQVISLQETDRHHWWTMIFGLAAIILFVLTLGVAPKTSFRLWSDGELAGVIFLCVLTAFCVLSCLTNLALGPACRCLIRTAVQTEELPSLNRVRRARRALARIRPLITAAQGELTPEEVSSRMRESAQGSESKFQSPEWNKAPEPQP